MSTDGRYRIFSFYFARPLACAFICMTISIAIVGASASTGGPTSADLTTNVWNQIRLAVLNQDCGYLGRPEYCIRDQDFVDGIIKRLVDKHFGGVVPHEPRNLAELIDYAQTDYMIALRSDEGLRRLEVLFHRRFVSPQILQTDSRVIIRFGFVPGRLSRGPRERIYTTDSAHLQNGHWKSESAASELVRYISMYGTSHIVDLEVEIADRLQTRWTYRYDRRVDRIFIFNSEMPTGAYVTPTAIGNDFPAYVAGYKRLELTHLRWERQAQLRVR